MHSLSLVPALTAMLVIYGGGGLFGRTAAAVEEDQRSGQGAAAAAGEGLEDELGRAAVHGHHTQAANRPYQQPPYPPFFAQPSKHPHLPPPPPGYHDKKIYSEEDHHYQNYIPDVETSDIVYTHDDDDDHYEEEEEDYGGAAAATYHKKGDTIQKEVAKAIKHLEKLIEILYGLKENNFYDVTTPPKQPAKKCSKSKKACDPAKWSKCSCLSPATFTDEGRGNCNLGATKMDIKVWCYVENKYGDPEKICPDAKASNSKQGYYWSRFACIT